MTFAPRIFAICLATLGSGAFFTGAEAQFRRPQQNEDCVLDNCADRRPGTPQRGNQRGPARETEDDAERDPPRGSTFPRRPSTSSGRFIYFCGSIRRR